MKRMWVAVEALRSSLGQLVFALPLWLEAHLQYEDFVSDVDLDMLWSLLGVPGEMRAEFVDLELRFECGALKISSRFALDPEAPQRVTGCRRSLERRGGGGRARSPTSRAGRRRA